MLVAKRVKITGDEEGLGNINNLQMFAYMLDNEKLFSPLAITAQFRQEEYWKRLVGSNRVVEGQQVASRKWIMLTQQAMDFFKGSPALTCMYEDLNTSPSTPREKSMDPKSLKAAKVAAFKETTVTKLVEYHTNKLIDAELFCLHEPLRLRGGAGDDPDDFGNLSYHSESEESTSSSDYGLVIENPKDPGILNKEITGFDLDEELFGDTAPSQVINSREDFDKISFNSSNSDKQLSNGESDSDFFLRDSDEAETSVVKGKLCDDIYNFTEDSSFDEIAEYKYKPKQLTICKTVQPLCSISECVAKASKDTSEIIKTLLSGKNKSEIKNQLLQHLKGQQRMGLTGSGFVFGGEFLCSKCFANESGQSNYIVEMVLHDLNTGLCKYEHGNLGGVKHSAATTNFIVWMKSFIVLYGQQAPDESVTVLPSFLKIKDIYEIYVTESEKPLILQSSFYNHFHSFFGKNRKDKSLPCVRISSYSTHSKCSQCIALVVLQRRSVSEDDLALAKSLKLKHRQCYSHARDYIENLRHLSISHPESHLFLQLDDMDNMKREDIKLKKYPI